MPSPTRRLPSDERRTQIAEVALELVAKDGIAALTTTTLATAVGITPGALFRHFVSMDAILVAVAERAVELLEASYPCAELPPLDRLDAFVSARTELATRKLGIPRLVLSEQFARALPEPARRKVRAAVRRSLVFVESAIDEGRADGSIRDVSTSGLALVVIGAIQMSVLEASVRRGRRTDLRHVLRTLLAKPSR